MKFLEKYIPGQPRLSMEYMEGAAGRKAANVIYSSTRPDGLTIGSIGAGLVVGPILGLPGSAYDLDKFIYLGSTDTGDPYIFYTKASLGLDTLEKVRASAGLRLGAHAVGHPVYVTGRMVAYLLDLKEPKFVTGYTGPEIYLAVTRGELDAHATGAARFVIENPEWIEKKLVHFHTTLTVPKGRHHPDIYAGRGTGELCQVGNGAQAAGYVPGLPVSALAVPFSSGNTERPRSDHPGSNPQVVCRS